MNGVLVDENVPACSAFSSELPVVTPQFSRKNPTDSEIWDYARYHKLVILSKDADFSNRIILSSPPPWVVHLRIGNMRAREFRSLLVKVWPQIEWLLKNHKLINVYLDRLEAIR